MNFYTLATNNWKTQPFNGKKIPVIATNFKILRFKFNESYTRPLHRKL